MNSAAGPSYWRRIRQAAKAKYDDRLEPVTCKIVPINQDCVAERLSFTKVGVQGREVYFYPPKSLWRDDSLPVNEDWFVDVKFCPRLGRSPKLGVANCTAMTPKKIRVSFPTGLSVGMLTLEVRVRSGSSGALSYYNAVFLPQTKMDRASTRWRRAIEKPEKISDTDKRHAAMHELGHTLGMCPVMQSTRYEGGGHKGRHCNYEADEDAIERGNYESAEGKCIMFGERWGSERFEFCPHCTTSLRATRVRCILNISDWDEE